MTDTYERVYVAYNILKAYSNPEDACIKVVSLDKKEFSTLLGAIAVMAVDRDSDVGITIDHSFEKIIRFKDQEAYDIVIAALENARPAVELPEDVSMVMSIVPPKAKE